ncbi:MAG: haloacid dehalogenase-like hydrolase [Bacteroidetes bacterium]|nr:haloacid dehalogenase-like hydrolase [Bacteroidota bacterium]
MCDTLYRSNTTFDFIRFVVAKRGRVSRVLLWAISSTQSPLFYVLILLNKITSRDWPRQLALQFLRGMSSEELEKEATQFYQQYLVPRANQEVFQYIKKPSVTAILLSSSISPVIKAIAQANGLLYFSSELELNDGKATGQLQIDMTGRKHEVAKKLMAERAILSVGVITDNYSDWELVKLADERLVVVASEAQKNFWKPLSPHFIVVS